MDKESLKDEVKQAIIALDLIATAKHPVTSFGDGYKQIGINFSLRACEIAAEVTGYDRTFCKMLNHKFRADASNMMFDRAMAEVA
jgi:hypothetical protein